MSSTLRADPGLDLEALRILRAPRHDEQAILNRIEAHFTVHAGYLPISGGKDSAVVAHLAQRVDRSIPLVFFDSGLEFPETYTFLDDIADRWGLHLHIEPVRPTLLEILLADGSWDHRAPLAEFDVDLHRHLITEPAARAHARFGDGELWGVRADEANGRRRLYESSLRKELQRSCFGCCSTAAQSRQRHGGIIRRIDGTIAFGPVWNWTTNDITDYAARHAMPLNPIYRKLQRLGAPPSAQRVSHVLDTFKLEEGRATWLQLGWPELFDALATVLPRLREYT